jgi:hypothetical protein
VIAEFNDRGLLPPGIHPSNWDELCNRFGWNERRKRILRGMKIALDSLKMAGCKFVYIDGSFVTNKEIPGDFDACWEPQGVNMQYLRSLDPVIFKGKNTQKVKYFGEIYAIIRTNKPYQPTILEFFQGDKESGERKGIVILDLEDMA